jgi:hypothetical protein
MPNWKKIIVSGSDASLNTLVVSNGITGSLLGTASFAISSSRAITASYALNGGVTQILAGANVTLSPTNGLGQVTISSTSGAGGFNTATGSYGSFYDTTTQTNPVANIPRSMSFNTTDITNGVSISGSTSPFNTYIKTQNAGVYNIQFSAQLDKTDSGVDEVIIWLRKNGSDLTDTATTISLNGNNDKQVAAWNWFVNSAANDYYQIIWYSADTDLRILAETTGGGHPGIPSVIATANRIDQFLSNTGSFTGSFTGVLIGTASYATQALSSSFATSALSSSFATTAISASFATTASFAISSSRAVTSSFAITASYVTGSIYTSTNPALSASFASTALSSSFATSALSSSFATTASFAISSSRAITSSFASTASFVANSLITASVSSNTITFTKGNGTTFPITVATGSAAPAFPFTGSAGITGSLSVVGPVSASAVYISGSGTQRLIVVGSGSASPIFTVQGSQGELFSVTDSLSGSLFSVNDISGLPIMEVFSDNTILMGDYQDPMLLTTKKVTQTNSGSFTIYSIPTASYDGAFIDYTIKSGSNARAGTIMSTWAGSSIEFTEVDTMDIGSTTAVGLTMILSGSNAIMTGSSTTGAWTIRTIIRAV